MCEMNEDIMISQLKQTLGGRPHLITYVDEVVDMSAFNGIVSKNMKIIANCQYEDAIIMLAGLIRSCADNYQIDEMDVIEECLRSIPPAPPNIC